MRYPEGLHVFIMIFCTAALFAACNKSSPSAEHGAAAPAVSAAGNRCDERKAAPAPAKKTRKSDAELTDELAKRYGKLCVVTTTDGETMIGSFRQVDQSNLELITIQGKITMPSGKVAQIAPYKNPAAEAEQ